MNLAVTAPCGKMGGLLVRAALQKPGIHLTSVIGPAGRGYLGQDSGHLSGAGRPSGVPVTSDWQDALADADILVDFSTADVVEEALRAAVSRGIPYLCGTTGLSELTRQRLHNASRTIPVMHAANTSRAVFLLRRLATLAAADLKGLADVEIVEMHGRDKLDAPSGTSLELGHALAGALELPFDEAAVFGRRGSSVRKEGQIGYHSVRAGDISSTHSILFGLLGERIEITHHAHNWQCFAEGALDCARFLSAQPPGLYTVEDVFGE